MTILNPAKKPEICRIQPAPTQRLNGIPQNLSIDRVSFKKHVHFGGNIYTMNLFFEWSQKQIDLTLNAQINYN